MRILIILLYMISVSAVNAADFIIEDYGGRTVLKMNGPIDKGTASKFSDIIREVPVQEHGHRILLLNSQGGLVSEAEKMADLMEIFPFHTIIPSDGSCASACASIVFIAGNLRTVDNYGRFGQHSCSAGGNINNYCNEKISERAVKQGISHGAIYSFLTLVGPSDVTWMSRKGVDGYGISKYPRLDSPPFPKQDPIMQEIVTGSAPKPTDLWRLEIFGKGWRSFVRTIRDDHRDYQLNLGCLYHQGDKLISVMIDFQDNSEDIVPHIIKIDGNKVDFLGYEIFQAGDYDSLSVYLNANMYENEIKKSKILEVMFYDSSGGINTLTSNLTLSKRTIDFSLERCIN